MILPMNPQLVKFFEHYLVCLVRRLDSIKRMKAKEREKFQEKVTNKKDYNNGNVEESKFFPINFG
jgi:hypothetical protein